MDAAVAPDACLDEQREAAEIVALLEALYVRHCVDFRQYAPGSLRRRLLHARCLLNCDSWPALERRLAATPALVPTLVNALTLPVSDVFRDPEFFLALRLTVLPHLATFPSIRVWVAGCGGGEEVYSLAILFREEGLFDRTVFYATDINSDALRTAAAGVYDLERADAFMANHRASGSRRSLSESCTAAYGRLAFDRALRQRMVFSDHSLATDAVFAEVQLVTCRNVLIYFDRPLQNRALGLFAEALSPGGGLGLGSKESLRFLPNQAAFESWVPAQRLFRRRSF